VLHNCHTARWIVQKGRGFLSNSPNGVRVQIWAALCANLLVAIAKQKKHHASSLYEILQVVSVSSLEQLSLEELFVKLDIGDDQLDSHNQLEIDYS
jgi:mannitol/fructose-specific phosphotransferase system IIA component